MRTLTRIATLGTAALIGAAWILALAGCPGDDSPPTAAHALGGTVSGLNGSVTLTNGTEDLVIDADGGFTFPTRLAEGTSYAVTVAAQPDGQTCNVANGSGVVGRTDVTDISVTCVDGTTAYSVGGTVTGLSGTGLVLQNNGGDDLSIASDGAFTFSVALGDGADYSVTVSSAPSGETCSVANGSGTISGADVTDVVVTCSAGSAYAVGGTVSGLTGTGLVLQNNGGDDLSVTADGPFTFPTPVADTAPYAVTVSTQPSGQTCMVASGSGNISGADVTDVVVTCSGTTGYTIGGTVSGLTGTGLVLQDNGGDDLTIGADGAFTFATPVSAGETYEVTISMQPSLQVCAIASGTGTATADVTTVVVTCQNVFTDVVDVAAGDSHSLMAKSDGTVWAVGDNSDGQLGDGTTNPSNLPVQVCDVGETAPCSNFLSNVEQVEAAGSVSFAIKTDGTVFAWGRNSTGQLGDGTVGTSRAVPVQVCAQGETDPCSNFISGVDEIAAAAAHTLARTGGNVLAWGDNSRGELGDDSFAQRRVPVWVCTDGASGGCPAQLAGVSAIAAGDDYYSVAIRGGEVLTWGYNDYGELGTGDTSQSMLPVAACADAACSGPLTGATAISAGLRTTLVVSSGSIFGFGDNFNGNLGDGNPTQTVTSAVEVCGDPPTCSMGLSNVVSVHAASAYSIALLDDSTAIAFGSGGDGALGRGDFASSDVPVTVCGDPDCNTTLSGIVGIAAGSTHVIARMNDGTVRSWGANVLGELGIGTNGDDGLSEFNREYPVPMLE